MAASPTSGGSSRIGHDPDRAARHHAPPELPPDAREPLASLPAGTTLELLRLIDKSLDRGLLAQALRVEMLLPPDLVREPAVVDRLATLRLMEGRVAEAHGILCTAPFATPRLQLLRTIVAMRSGDALAALALSNGPCATESLGLRVLARLLACIVWDGSTFRFVADPTAAVCAAAREGVVAAHLGGPDCLVGCIRRLTALLGPNGVGALTSSLALAIERALRSVAQDLAVPLVEAPDELGVTPEDCDRLNLRAA